MSEWNETTLGDVVAAGHGRIQTGPFGSQLHASDYVDSGIPCIMPVNMKNNRVDLNGIAFISDEDAERLSQHLVQAGDIVYSRRGDVTQKAIIREDEAGYFCGTGCLLVRPGTAINSEFLLYHLSTPSNQEWIVKQAVGATMPNLNTGILSKVPLRVPSTESQKKIATALSTLDAKIDLNQRINAELEALAKTIYDYWFVQFDFPDVHGRPYKSSGGAMVWNDTLKREIPAGWEAGVLSDIAKITMGQSPAGDSYNEDGRGEVFFQGSTDFGARSPDVRMYTTAPGRMARKGDILMSVRAPVGTLNIADRPCCIGRGLAALRGKDGSGGYLYRVLMDLKQVFDRRSSEGTTFGSINKNDLFGLRVLIPKPEVRRAYEEMAHNWFQLDALRDKESRELTQLRDWLLPLLMNGQVRVA